AVARRSSVQCSACSADRIPEKLRAALARSAAADRPLHDGHVGPARLRGLEGICRRGAAQSSSHHYTDPHRHRLALIISPAPCENRGGGSDSPTGPGTPYQDTHALAGTEHVSSDRLCTKSPFEAPQARQNVARPQGRGNLSREKE